MQQSPDHRPSPWHAGEKTLQEKVGVAERMEAFGQKVIRDYMPDQHRTFYHQLPFMVAASVDAQGRPWATLLEGPEGFVSSPDPRQLTIDARLAADDPATPGLVAGQAIGLLGIELHTRRRNRLNGQIRKAVAGQLQVTVEQSFGNCPQYIQLRDYTRVAEPAQGRIDATALDATTVSMIQSADTFFVASYVEHDNGQRSVDVSHRGGRPGFVRVQGNTLTIPDYAGNLHFNTLGNLLVNPRAGLLFIDFSNGNVLQVCGRAEVLLESPAIQAFEGAERLWTLEVDQVVWRPAAVSLRWAFKEYAPTSLMTGTWAEADARLQQRQQQHQWQAWRVLRVEQESRDIRSFYLQPPSDSAVVFAPGQHVPVQVKRDDEAPLIRTYSLSSAPSDGYWRISVKAQGPVSRHLHARIAPGDVLDVRPPMGSFTLDVQSTRPLVLIGAGVGITPLLAMLREQLSQGQARAIHVFQGARSLADLPFRQELASLQQRAEGLLHIHRALSQPESHALLGRDYEFAGRLGIGQVKATLALDDYEFYLCGPGSFTQDLYEGLRGVHVPDARIHAEAFGPSTLRRHTHADQPALQQPPAASEPVPVYFSASAKEARWAPGGGTLLELAEARGLAPEFSCRGGSCGTCKTRLVSGQVHYPNPPAELPEAGSVLICCAVPAQVQEGVQALVLDI
ncbi:MULTISPECIES: pyridoxamine 5'-phosphate oxidase family protein [Pseudomonas]|jgi:ferredoxin-NADP reductase/predicted pyridoxine 5'-phosphate oxidase superfamily flavin-nucleotide-binding protein|uniref:pyridoxamine 5'-phosphate oxidase family protein n=1 Tax=Pseudomonas TaxID=286 RepID=UPI0001FB9804|nr:MULTISPECIES: pyridoxamine 5'-phosphate oxidase family protein [Pseudomonas]EGB99578.1 FAD-binding oxidoreductase [Pseudomonas sp. TJI-51]MBA6124433.1 pyridoxamine 5'-phosphate oxidase family protein [Pseudomonas juntendi]MBI6913937.1 pyridoxamine 5'-phosphate oxidase family protein [Pseudomonas juntendi]MCF3158953.1 pyridoxamine 5'-phosphate oxidase family protein [Pseudomonas juntendi]MCQ1992174.1 pyridoxamine 5'-phosphate oxidase family protein [Pseudomonas sp. Eb3]